MTEVLYDKKKTCLYCHKDFTTKRMRMNYIRILKKDSDFCPYFKGENPLFYDFNICPSCGFAFTDGFSPISKGKREQIKGEYIDKIEIPQMCGTRSLLDALKGYKLTLFCASILDEKNFILANLCMRIAWMNRYLDNKKEEQRFLENALKMYEKIYQTESISALPIEEEKLLYLIGELHARLGHYETTRKCFSYFFTHPSITPKWRNFVRDRWLEIRNMQSVVQEDPEGFHH